MMSYNDGKMIRAKWLKNYDQNRNLQQTKNEVAHILFSPEMTVYREYYVLTVYMSAFENDPSDWF